jgi:hypothetical protein
LWWCLSGNTPAQLPNLTSLAARFAISDRTFSIPMITRPVPRGDHIDWAQAQQDT